MKRKRQSSNEFIRSKKRITGYAPVYRPLPSRKVYPRKGDMVSTRVADSKYFDVAYDNSHEMNTAGFVEHLDIIPQGDTITSRTGKSFQITNIHAHITLDSVHTRQNDILLYLIWDKQPNKAKPALADIFTVNNTSRTFLNRDYKDRFIPLKKWARAVVGYCNTNETTTSSFQLIDKWMDVRKHNLVANCTAADTTGAIGNRNTGSLLLVGLGNQVATSGVDLIYGFRLGFVDPS